MYLSGSNPDIIIIAIESSFVKRYSLVFSDSFLKMFSALVEIVYDCSKMQQNKQTAVIKYVQFFH